jgi:IS4 transposase
MAVAGEGPSTDIRWQHTVQIETEDGAASEYCFALHVPAHAPVENVEELVGDLYVDSQLPDPRKGWHQNTKPLQYWVRAHLVRLVKGWHSETRLADHLADDSLLALDLGFRNSENSQHARPDPPSQPQLWTIWEETLPGSFQDALEEVAEELVELARDNGIAAPAEVFQPEDKSEVGPRSERRYWKKEVKKVWKESKPIFERHIKLLRGPNAQLPQSAFLAQHARVGTRQDQYIEDGHDSFVEDSTRDEEDVPVGSHHRYTIRSRSVKTMREQHHSFLEEMLRIVSGADGLPSELRLAIDLTPGFQWYGQMERDADGNPADSHILGTKKGYYARKYATIQLINPEMPFILDCIPVTRGMPRAKIVDELLDTATDLLGHYGIDIVVMDRAFDGEAVKDVHDDYGIHYFNTRRRLDDEQTVIERMKATELTALSVVNERDGDGNPERVQLYLPIRTDDSEEESEEGETHDAGPSADPLSVTQRLEESPEEEFGFDLESWEPSGTSPSTPAEPRSLREQMADEFGVDVGGEDEEEGGHPFEELVESMRDEAPDGRQGRPASSTASDPEDDDQQQEYIVFETNHPYVTERIDATAGQAELAHLAARASRRFYRSRDRIETGYQDLKPFMVRTTSNSPRYRFFCFHFAALMTNVWRIADLLAKLAADREADLTDGPKITKHTFFSIMKKQLDGLDPPV